MKASSQDGPAPAPAYVFLHSEDVIQKWFFVDIANSPDHGWGQVMGFVQHGNWRAMRDGEDLRLFPTQGSVGTA